MTLNCGHVFCQFCINEWEAKCGKKSNFTCPNCRELVVSQARSLHLENLIAALFRDIDASMAADREKLVQERQAEIEKAAKNKSKKQPAKKPTGNIRDWAQRAQSGGPQNDNVNT